MARQCISRVVKTNVGKSIIHLLLIISAEYMYRLDLPNSSYKWAVQGLQSILDFLAAGYFQDLLHMASHRMRSKPAAQIDLIFS